MSRGNYIDGKGNYHNEENLTLAQIYDSGKEFGLEKGYEIAKRDFIKELEKIKSEVKKQYSFYTDYGVQLGCESSCEIIDNRIAKLKGE